MATVRMSLDGDRPSTLGRQLSGEKRGSVLETLLNKHDAQLEERLARAESRKRAGSVDAPRLSDDDASNSGNPGLRRLSTSTSSPGPAGDDVSNPRGRRHSMGGRVRRTSSEKIGGAQDALSAAAREQRTRLEQRDRRTSGEFPRRSSGISSELRSSASLERMRGGADTLERRGSTDVMDPRERRQSNDDLFDSPPKQALLGGGSEVELLRFRTQDLEAALRMEQAANEELRKKVAKLELENHNLRDYMNDRLV